MRETLETKAYPNRDGNHAQLRLCHPLRQNPGKKREKCREVSAINLAMIGADNVMSLAFVSCLAGSIDRHLEWGQVEATSPEEV